MSNLNDPQHQKDTQPGAGKESASTDSSRLIPIPLMMRAWRRSSDGILQLEEVRTPAPGPGEALVRVSTAGLNPVDAKASFRKVKLSTGVDGAGRVVSFGDGTVTDLKVGTRAMFHASLHAMRNGRPEVGSFAEYSIVPIDALVPIPDHIAFTEAASLPCPAGTAQQILDGLQQHLSNCSLSRPAVFVQGASGAVARFVVQLLRKHHPTVAVIGSASLSNHSDLESLGIVPVSYSDSSGNSSPATEFAAVESILTDRQLFLAAIVNFQGGESVDLHYLKLDAQGKLICVLNPPANSSDRKDPPIVGVIALGQAYDVQAGVVEPKDAVEAYQQIAPEGAVSAMANAYRRVLGQIQSERFLGITLPRIEIVTFGQIGECLLGSGKIVADLGEV